MLAAPINGIFFKHPEKAWDFPHLNIKILLADYSRFYLLFRVTSTCSTAFPNCSVQPLTHTTKNCKLPSPLFGQIHQLYEEFTKDMHDATINEPQKKVLLAGVASVAQSIYPVQFNAGFRPLTDAEKSLLEVCATIIPEEEFLLPEDIETIRDSIKELRDLVQRQRHFAPLLRRSFSISFGFRKTRYLDLIFTARVGCVRHSSPCWVMLPSFTTR